MIPQRNISLISNTLQSAGGRRIPEAVIERDYVLAWFLTGLAGHPLRDVLAFKGRHRAAPLLVRGLPILGRLGLHTDATNRTRRNLGRHERYLRLN